MPDGVKPEIPHLGILTELLHDLLPVVVWPFDVLSLLSAPISVPEYPRLLRIPFLISPAKNLMKLFAHRHLSRSEMATGLFPGVEDDVATLKINIVPRQPVDFTDPCHGFPDDP